jgi:hypothetical protein
MEFTRTTAAVAFLAVVAIGVGGLIAGPIPMGTGTILMMVLPSMVVFGAICLWIGVQYGRTTAAR